VVTSRKRNGGGRVMAHFGSWRRVGVTGGGVAYSMALIYDGRAVAAYVAMYGGNKPAWQRRGVA